jgi:(4S)-4-hydroxy-5-phosphonooxypentane-2,3-dione isomerase
MVITFVHAAVKPDRIEDFRRATLENAENSIREPGVIRFDVFQRKDDPERFVLVEIYRTAGDPAKHKETAHYRIWRDTVADWMAEPREGVQYAPVFPNESAWTAV